jgi:uncharacterized membrane protein YfcA
MIIIAVIFLVGFLAGLFGGLAGGGGGLIAIPVLIFFGLPPNIAIATNRLGSLGVGLSAIYQFFSAKKIVFKYVIPLLIASVAGSIIGAKILIAIDQTTLSKTVGILMILILPFVFFDKDAGIKRKIKSKYCKALGFAGYFVVAIYDGFFGAGAGIFAAYLLIMTLGLTYLEAHATDQIPWFFNTLISTAIFAFYGIINYSYGIALLCGMFVGGYLGTHTAIAKGNKFVKLAFSMLVAVSAVKMIFF